MITVKGNPILASDQKYKVYCHRSPSGKRYIGQTCLSLNERSGLNGKNYKGCVIFYNAIQKYGWNNFQHLILADNLSKQEADELEINYIEQYHTRSRRFGYNMKLGGHHAPPANGGYWAGKTLAESHKLAISEAGIGKRHTNESKAIMREKAIGRKHSEETKQKLSQMNKGIYNPPKNPEQASANKSAATKKLWEERRRNANSQRRPLISVSRGNIR